MDPNNPHWGWSWLERWMAARPWESKSTVDNNDRASIKSAASHAMSLGEITKAYYCREDNDDSSKPSSVPKKPSCPASRHSPSTHVSKAPSSSSLTGKTPKANGWGRDEDLRSVFSVQSERYRRHSIAGSSVRDDESLASSPSVPSYMAPTRSAKAKSRLPSPLSAEKNGTPEKGSLSVSSAKKRLTFPGTPVGSRRHSGPPKVDISTIKDTAVLNGGGSM